MSEPGPSSQAVPGLPWGCPGGALGVLRAPDFSQIVPCFPRPDPAPRHSQHRDGLQVQPRWEIHPFQDPQHHPSPQTQQNPTLGWVIRGCPRAESSRGEPPSLEYFPSRFNIPPALDSDAIHPFPALIRYSIKKMHLHPGLRQH